MQCMKKHRFDVIKGNTFCFRQHPNKVHSIIICKALPFASTVVSMAKPCVACGWTSPESPCLRCAITVMYEVCNPKQLERIDAIFVNYNSGEKELLSALVNKYECEDSPFRIINECAYPPDGSPPFCPMQAWFQHGCDATHGDLFTFAKQHPDLFVVHGTCILPMEKRTFNLSHRMALRRDAQGFVEIR